MAAAARATSARLDRTAALAEDLGQERVRSGDRAALAWLFSSIAWLTIVDGFGAIIATEFIEPDVFGGIAWLEFGRVRPTHVNGVIFAWLSMMYVGAIFYILPRLVGTRGMWSERLGIWTAVAWNVMFLAGWLTIWAGFTQGREYAEFIWPVDVALLVIWLLVILNIVMTVVHRRTRSIYVSVWWFLASPAWLAVDYFIGNVMWRPGAILGSTAGLDASGALPASLDDAIFNWWYSHNVFGLWLTPMLVALTYYFVPRITNTPLYSHTLSLISFWGIALFYTGVGHHHLLQSPTPDWLKAFATANSILLLVPVFAFVINILMTMRGSWEKFFTHLPLRFVLTGFVFYFLVNIQGSAQALPDFNALTHFTNFVVAHAHLALLGGFTFLGMGAIDYIVPQVLGRPLFSRTLELWQYWMVFVGFTGFFASLTIAGFLQGQMWEQGIPEASVLVSLKPWFIGRAVFGVMIVISGIILAVNIALTVRTDTRARHRRLAERDLASAAMGGT